MVHIISPCFTDPWVCTDFELWSVPIGLMGFKQKQVGTIRYALLSFWPSVCSRRKTLNAAVLKLCRSAQHLSWRNKTMLCYFLCFQLAVVWCRSMMTTTMVPVSLWQSLAIHWIRIVLMLFWTALLSLMMSQTFQLEFVCFSRYITYSIWNSTTASQVAHLSSCRSCWWRSATRSWAQNCCHWTKSCCLPMASRTVSATDCSVCSRSKVVTCCEQQTVLWHLVSMPHILLVWNSCYCICLQGC